MAKQNSTSYSKRTKNAKDNAGIAAMAMKLAKDQNHPLIKKKEKYRKLYLETKIKILQIFRSKAKTEYFAKKASKD